jgi:hypothetical protein
MKRWFPMSAFALVLLAACSTSRPVVVVDPVTDPTIIGAIDESAREGSIAAEEGARTGRRIGQVAGVVAAVLGGPRHDTLEDAVGRYLLTRDLAEATGAIIGGSRGAKAGAKTRHGARPAICGTAQDRGVKVFRPTPDQIDVLFDESPNPQMLTEIAAVFAGREERAIDIQGPDDSSFAVRDSLIGLGVSNAAIQARRDDHLRGIIIRIRYRD